MSFSILDDEDIDTLKYIVTHVFLPLKLPDGDDHSVHNDCSLAGAIASAAHLYSDHVDKADLPEWHRISRMLDNLQATVKFESLDRFRTVSQFRGMHVGGELLIFTTLSKLTMCRCPRIPHPSTKCGGHFQEAERRDRL